MKKNLILTALLVAAALPAFAAEKSGVEVNVTVTKAGSLVGEYDVISVNGDAVPFAAQSEVPYRTAGSRNRFGQIEFSMAIARSGVIGSLSAKTVEDGKIQADVAMSIDEVVAMHEFTSNGITTQAPEMTGAHLRQAMVLQDSQPKTLKFGAYAIVISARKI